jgi:hypothetical protein
MLKKVISLFLLTLSLVSNAQVGIGTSTPNASAILDISSTGKGVLLPRLTTAQINGIQNPEPGLLVFNASTKKFMGYGNKYLSASSISNTTLAGNGTYYMSLMNTVSPMNAIVDVGQTLSFSNATKLNSIALWFVVLQNGPANVSVSVYTGNTPGSGSLVGTATQTVSTTGQSLFTFGSPLTLEPGNYYLLVHTSTVGVTAGLGYSVTQYGSNIMFQGQSFSGGAFSYTTNTNSLYFIMNINDTGLAWCELN